MKTIGELSALYYRNLSNLCDKYHVELNLDIQDPSRRIFREKALIKFLNEALYTGINAARGSEGAHVDIIQRNIALSNLSQIAVKFSTKLAFDEDKQEELEAAGYNVRTRFGFDTIISIKI